MVQSIRFLSEQSTNLGLALYVYIGRISGSQVDTFYIQIVFKLLENMVLWILWCSRSQFGSLSSYISGMQFARVFLLLLVFQTLHFEQGKATEVKLPIKVEQSLRYILETPIADTLRAHAFNEIANHLQKQDILESVFFRRLALEFSEGTSAHFMSMLYENLVWDNFAMGNTTEATNLAREAVETLKDAPPKYQAGAQRLLLYAYIQIRDFEKAIPCGQTCVDMAREHDPEQLAFTLSLAGEANAHSMHNEEGISLLKESSKLLSHDNQNFDDYSSMISNEIFTSLCYLQMDQLDSSKAIIIRTGERLAQRSDPPREVLLWLLWAEYYEAIGEYQMALSSLDSCRPTANQLNNGLFQLYIKSYSSRIHAQMGNFSQALTDANRQLELKDSIDNEEVKNSVQVLNLNHELKVEAIKSSLQRNHLQAELRAKNAKHEKNQLYYILALVLTLGIIMYLIFRNRHRKSKLLASELELSNERIKAELEKKSANLSNNILRIASMNSFMVEIQKELEKNKGELSEGQLNKVNRLIRRIKTRSDDNIWSEFEIRFEQAHKGFYKQLIQDFPALTPNERRLCAFLKLNMTSKEISRITGQTPHSINVARGRLRKKLDIVNEDVSLVEFISRY